MTKNAYFEKMADFATERLRVTRRRRSQSCPLSSCTSGSLSTPAGWLQGPGPGCLPLHWNSHSNLLESKGEKELKSQQSMDQEKSYVSRSFASQIIQ